MLKKAMDKLVKRVNAPCSSGKKRQDNLQQYNSITTLERGSETIGEQVVDSRVKWNDLDRKGITIDRTANGQREMDSDIFQNTIMDVDEEMDDMDWEDGSTHILNPASNVLGDDIGNITIEISESPDILKRKPIRRATTEDKECAELVHKVHLLCLLARGRIIDTACDDPLIQASILSLLPVHLLKISEVSKLSANALSPIVSWFHNKFRVRKPVNEKRSFQSALALALETREGTPEEIAALSVALFRALSLSTRFVAILDVASIKPEAHKCKSDQATSQAGEIFNASTLMVDRVEESKSLSCNKKEQNICEYSNSLKNKDCHLSSLQSQTKDSPYDPFLRRREDKISEVRITQTSEGSKRKGDLEFEMQLQMALDATAIAAFQSSKSSDMEISNNNSLNFSSPFKRMRGSASEEGSPSKGISTAVGSRKIGSPLYWAEVYCNEENFAGKWVHVDVINAIIDSEGKVEAAAAACKTSLRYVVAFAGHGAKDVTRRYCMKWYKVASQRVNSVWWDEVVSPLRELEAAATSGVVHFVGDNVDSSNQHEKEKGSRASDYPVQDDHLKCVTLPSEITFNATRSSLEDMELETRALTELLPTNQQAYKNHPLYAIERWLKKCQILHPKGPVLGFCSGHPVYPRSCVQTLKTKERWLREGLQVKVDEIPAKVLKQCEKLKKAQHLHDDDDDYYGEVNSKGNIELYGKWQLEPLQLPHALNGIVPKNERGQVDVWSEKCLPPGTVHLRLPRVFYVAKRLEIDYAPAMVGFEFRNGRSFPVYDGIVVCTEFKNAILEAYAEEEERREAEEKKRNETQTIARWYQLLSSIITRQRLTNRYGNMLPMGMPSNVLVTKNEPDMHVHSLCHKQIKNEMHDSRFEASSDAPSEDHEHVFLVEDQSFNEESSVRIKRCRCGFSVQVEEL